MIRSFRAPESLLLRTSSGVLKAGRRLINQTADLLIISTLGSDSFNTALQPSYSERDRKSKYRIFVLLR